MLYSSHGAVDGSVPLALDPALVRELGSRHEKNLADAIGVVLG